MKSRGKLKMNKIEGIEIDMDVEYEIEISLEEMKFLWNAQKEVPEVVEDFVRKILELKKELADEITEIKGNVAGGRNHDKK